MLHATARRVLGNDEDAYDCIHDVLMRLWQRDPTYRPERGSLRTYLAVAVRNEAISRKRREQRHARIERSAATAQAQSYDIEIPDAIDLGRLRSALAKLPPEQRAVLQLAYRGQLSHREIAERLDLPLGTVKSRLVLAMRKLAAAVR